MQVASTATRASQIRRCVVGISTTSIASFTSFATHAVSSSRRRRFISSTFTRRISKGMMGMRMRFCLRSRRAMTVNWIFQFHRKTFRNVWCAASSTIITTTYCDTWKRNIRIRCRRLTSARNVPTRSSANKLTCAIIWWKFITRLTCHRDSWCNTRLGKWSCQLISAKLRDVTASSEKNPSGWSIR